MDYTFPASLPILHIPVCSWIPHGLLPCGVHGHHINCEPRKYNSLSSRAGGEGRCAWRLYWELPPAIRLITCNARHPIFSNMNVPGQHRRPQRDLAAYFNKSVSTVQLYADRQVICYFLSKSATTSDHVSNLCSLEHDVVRPAFASSNLFFKERPITAVRGYPISACSGHQMALIADLYCHIFFI